MPINYRPDWWHAGKMYFLERKFAYMCVCYIRIREWKPHLLPAWNLESRVNVTKRNKSHGEVIRVCMGIFTTPLRNIKIQSNSHKNTSPYFHSASFVIWPLTMLKRTLFSKFSFDQPSVIILNIKKIRSNFSDPTGKMCLSCL